MELKAERRGYLDFDITTIKCFVLSNGLHALQLNEYVKHIADSQGYKPEYYYEVDQNQFTVIPGVDFVDCCKSFIKDYPNGSREYQVAEMFVNLTRYVSIDAFIWEACLPDNERILANFDETISKILKHTK